MTVSVAGKRKSLLFTGVAALALTLSSCSGGGGGDNGATGGVGGTPTPAPIPTPTPTPTPAPTPSSDSVFESPQSTMRFLSHSTFGPNPADVDQLVGTNASDWFQTQLALPRSRNMPYVLNILSSPEGFNPDGNVSYLSTMSPRLSFWQNAVSGDDQLRQRMAFALSEILVISHLANDVLAGRPTAVAYYQDLLSEHAFGNYRDLMEAVTYSPAMGEFLTYLQNQKGDQASGRMPDENYARELMQLFTIGLNELNIDGTVRTDGNGQPLETYTNDDITGLARVFTGLSLAADEFWYTQPHEGAWRSPMMAFPEFHSDLEKSFLGTTIPAGTGPEESIDLALDALFNHPNVGPFLGRQLIQRFVTSNPSRGYVQRVATTFNTGSYTLPNGDVVGEGVRGDLTATLATVLMDDEALGDSTLFDSGFGKIREPVMRFTQWARAFDASPVDPRYTYELWFTQEPGSLAQAPYGAPSVFNFFRPGYVAPGTQTGDAGMTVPELQLMNAGTVPGYVNFISYFAYGIAANYDPPEEQTFLPDYSDEIAIADDAEALVDHLGLYLTSGTLTAETRDDISDLVSFINVSAGTDPEDNGRLDRVRLAVVLIMSSPDYLVQR